MLTLVSTLSLVEELYTTDTELCAKYNSSEMLRSQYKKVDQTATYGSQQVELMQQTLQSHIHTYTHTARSQNTIQKTASYAPPLISAIYNNGFYLQTKYCTAMFVETAHTLTGNCPKCTNSD